MNIQEDLPHPIIKRPDLNYEIIGISYQQNPRDWQDCHLDLILQHQQDHHIRRLRFLSPQELEISGGRPSTCGMEILDVSQRKLENLNVWVTNYENSGGAITFWAKDVIDLDTIEQVSNSV